MKDMEKEICENCKFWDTENRITDGYLELCPCRRLPPVLMSCQWLTKEELEDCDAPGDQAKWPETHQVDWCGEWEVKA